jgi:4-hydroxybenzoate polyprenyltransferase
VIRRLRLVLLVVRPPVALLFGLYAAIGLAQAGHGEDRPLLLRVLLVVFGFLMFSVACNDIADVEIDRVNLTGDRRRPLVARTGGRREMLVIGMTAALVSLGVSATLGWPVLAVTSCGVLLSANYSLRPVRFADRGALASLLLPACYVAVPFLAGYLAAAPVVHARAVLLLFGVERPGGTLIAAYVAGAAGILVLLRLLAAEPGHHRDDAVIAAITMFRHGPVSGLRAVWSRQPRAGRAAISTWLPQR